MIITAMFSSLSQQLRFSLGWPLRFVALLWVVHGIQYLFNLDLGYYGIYPREVIGLRGIVLAPLIHGSWGHLLSNTPPLFALSAMLLFFYRRVAIPSFILIYLLTGLMVWLFGRSVFHIGASGVIYGLVAFLFWSGIFRRNARAIALALIVVFYYGSMFMGILPGQEGISWESHLLGALVGIVVAFASRGQLEEAEKQLRSKPDDTQPEYFLDRDTFDRPRPNRTQDTNGHPPTSRWYVSDTTRKSQRSNRDRL